MRALAVDGLVNARDLGGLPLREGGATPCGVFFRSENVDALTTRGWDELHRLGVRTVVDLRQPAERERDRRPRPGWVVTAHVDSDGPRRGTGTEQAFRDALAGLDLDAFLGRAGLSAGTQRRLRTWRGSVTAGDGTR